VSTYSTYQYTYMENVYKHIGQVGAVNFNYHIGGMQIDIKPTTEDITTFLVHLCAIIGGAYAIAQAMHNFISNFTNKYQYQLI